MAAGAQALNGLGHSVKRLSHYPLLLANLAEKGGILPFAPFDRTSAAVAEAAIRPPKAVSGESSLGLARRYCELAMIACEELMAELDAADKVTTAYSATANLAGARHGR